jgi:hypothetical protein
MILWETMKDADGICNTDLEEVISKLGGDGITLPQARRACKDGIFSFSDAVRAATALRLPNCKLAVGKVVAHVHPKAKDYYKDKDTYYRNQKALEEDRLEDIDIDAAAWAAEAVAWDARAARAARAVWAVEAAGVAAAARAAVDAAGAVDNVDTLIDTYFDVLEEV